MTSRTDSRDVHVHICCIGCTMLPPGEQERLSFSRFWQSCYQRLNVQGLGQGQGQGQGLMFQGQGQE